MAPTRKKSATKQPSPPPVVLSNGMIISEPTSFASRKRLHPGLSIAALRGASSTQHEITDHAATFDPLSVAHYTWGIPNAAGISAIQSKRKHGGLRRSGFRRGKKSIYEECMYPDRIPTEHLLPNSPESSKLLYVSLEIRELIYGYLLVHDRPILVHSDWRTIMRKSVHDHGILMVCKQFAEEGTQFFYRQNKFTARINEMPVTSLADAKIDARYLKYMKNVTVDIPGENQDAKGMRDTSNCVGRLGKANACLESLTITAAPRTNESTGNFTFANFFRRESILLRAITLLTVKRLIISIRHPRNHPQTRTTFTINLWALQVDRAARAQEDRWLAGNVVAVKTRTYGVVKARLELRTLRGKIRAVTEEIEAAMREMEQDMAGADEGAQQQVDAGEGMMGSRGSGVAA